VGLALQLGERPAEHGSIGQLLRARRHEQEHAPSLEAAANEGQQPEAHLVRPVDVLKDHHRWLPLHHLSE
jgi:hypothetical protein